ncbi:MAG: GAF domain-containing protein, partial [Gammaproteobacteria bacterium]
MAVSLENIPQIPLVDDQRLRPVIDLVATSLNQERFEAAATAVLAELASQFGCNSCSYGVIEKGHCVVQAASHTASLDSRMNLSRLTAQAMDEAVEQDSTLLYPAPKKSARRVTHTHAELAKHSKAGTICTFPVNHNGVLVGAVLLEHPAQGAFDTSAVETGESIVALVGPI